MTNHKLPNKIDLSKCILWQYNKADRLQGLIKGIEESYEACTVDMWKKLPLLFNIQDPISDYDNLDLREIGITMIAQLFGIELPAIEVSDDFTRDMKLEALRRYLRGKIYLIDSDGSCKDINEYLKIVLPDVSAYVQETYALNESGGWFTMAINYVGVSDSEITEADHPISHKLVTSVKDFLPRPAGVLIGEPTPIKLYKFTTQVYQGGLTEETTEEDEIVIEENSLNTFDNSIFEVENK